MQFSAKRPFLNTLLIVLLVLTAPHLLAVDTSSSERPAAVSGLSVTVKKNTPANSATNKPPFWGTIFVDPDIVTSDDISTFISTSYEGTDSRIMYDRRAADWVTLQPFIFVATFDDGLSTEVQVNPEFSDWENAKNEADKYAWLIGQLPTSLRTKVETVWIHRGTESFGGGNNNILIHTGRAEKYIADGIIEETLIHEGSHTSLDSEHSNHKDWLEAQKQDEFYISQFALDNPGREDVAESFLTYFAVRYRRERISDALYEKIMTAIPHRIEYFDNIDLKAYPAK